LKYLPLILAGLWRKPVRTILTFLSIVVAFVLFGILSAIDAGFAHRLEAARLDRLFADPRFGGLMPIAYADKIAAVPGVTVVAPRMGLVGYYKDPKDGMGVIMTDARFFAARSELTATKQQIEQLQRTPSGALVGSYFVEKYGWKVGDTIPLISNTVKRDGTRSGRSIFWASSRIRTTRAPRDISSAITNISMRHASLTRARPTAF